MRLKGSELSRSRPSVVAPRTFIEIVVAIIASTIMALMVLGAGIAAERWTTVQDVPAYGPSNDPDPLAWGEST